MTTAVLERPEATTQHDAEELLADFLKKRRRIRDQNVAAIMNRQDFWPTPWTQVSWLPENWKNHSRVLPGRPQTWPSAETIGLMEHATFLAQLREYWQKLAVVRALVDKDLDWQPRKFEPAASQMPGRIDYSGMNYFGGLWIAGGAVIGALCLIALCAG